MIDLPLQVQGDVFRFPPYYPFFCALIGTGVQLVLMIYCTTILSIVGTLYVGRGAVSSTAVFMFALTSVSTYAVCTVLVVLMQHQILVLWPVVMFGGLCDRHLYLSLPGMLQMHVRFPLFLRATCAGTLFVFGALPVGQGAL